MSGSRAAPLEWKEHKITPSDGKGEDPPSSRTYFSMVAHDSKLWLFGGFGDSKGRFNDLRTFDTKTRRWALQEVRGDGPKPIYLHTSAIYDGRMWVFGGSTGADTNDLYSMDFGSLSWTRIDSIGAIPSPRYGHSAVVNGTQMIVVGGCKQSSQYFKDTYTLDLITKRWRKLGDVPYELAYHSLLTYNDRVYLYGGYNGVKFGTSLLVLDQTSGLWEIVDCKGVAPQPRCGCAAQVVGKYLFVFGGYTKDGHTNEMYKFDMDTRTWESVETREKPNSRAYLQAAVVNGTMFIFGGYDGTKCVTDFRSVELAPDVPNIAKIYSDEFHTLGEYSVRTFGKIQPGFLTASEVMAMWNNFASNGGGVGGSGGAVKVVPAIPFDISAAADCQAFGFEYNDIIDTMAQMHSAGQDTKNASLIVDKLLKAATTGVKPPRYVPPSLPAAPTLGRQKSETAELKATVATLKEQNDDLRNCKICFDNVMNVVVQPCGHLAICSECAAGLTKKGNTECPICRKKVHNHLQIYWI